MNNWKRKNGFTLVELLVVVLIIGVLSVIALPMYQKAVLKSRFAALMPIGKSIADSNEAYYLEHGEYASTPQDLPIQGQDSYPEGTSIELMGDENYDYTIVYNEDKLPDNNYIAFQKHSMQFADTTMCEARNEAAGEVCVAMGGTPLDGSITSGWTAYLLSGSAGGSSFLKECPAGGATLACSTGAPLPGTCNTQTGTWSYPGACGSIQQAHETVQQYDGILEAIWNIRKDNPYMKLSDMVSEVGLDACSPLSGSGVVNVYKCGDSVLIDGGDGSSPPYTWAQLQYCPGRANDYWGCMSSRELIHAHSSSKPNYCVSYDSFGYEFCNTYSDFYGTEDKRF